MSIVPIDRSDRCSCVSKFHWRRKLLNFARPRGIFRGYWSGSGICSNANFTNLLLCRKNLYDVHDEVLFVTVPRTVNWSCTTSQNFTEFYCKFMSGESDAHSFAGIKSKTVCTGICIQDYKFTEFHY